MAHAAALRLRIANILSSEIGLPLLEPESGIGHAGGAGTGIRVGPPEIVRWGMTSADMPEMAELIVHALVEDPATVAERTTEFRSRFTDLHFIRN